MANKEKKRKRNNPHHDYEALEFFTDENNLRLHFFHKGDLVYESDYEKLSRNNKKKCKSLPPKEILIKEKVKREKKENKVKIESKGFDFVTSFRKQKQDAKG